LTPTARSLAWLRQRGYLAGVVESWVPRANVRRDLFAFADILAAKAGEPVLLVQTTSAANVAARLRKIQQTPAAALWLQVGRIEIHGWAMRAGKWTPRVLEVLAGDLQPLELLALPRRRGGKGRTQRTLWDGEPGAVS